MENGQEALNNVSKHANVREATIYFKVTEKNVSLEIVDQGTGFVEKDIKEEITWHDYDARKSRISRWNN